ncbi:hypothetical protein GCM10027567_10050 [Spongiibacter taiwanensis]
MVAQIIRSACWAAISPEGDITTQSQPGNRTAAAASGRAFFSEGEGKIDISARKSGY